MSVHTVEPRHGTERGETTSAAAAVARALVDRNRPLSDFFARESARLAEACREMADRFLRGGRLIAFGEDAYATDAQHVSVEFVHPVIVGKRALPALDVSAAYASWVPAIVRPEDIVMGFGPPDGDARVAEAVAVARARGAQTFAFMRGARADFTIDDPIGAPFAQQEVVETLYHTLWETVHVYFEHRERGHDVGDAGFLYPFLGTAKQDLDQVVPQVAASIVAKADDVASLRARVANESAEAIARAASAMRERIDRGGSLLVFGNGGSATDANDWTIGCVSPPAGRRAVPAISLAMEPAVISALANDLGAEAVFLRQVIAQAHPADVAVAISTSGGSANVIAALGEARARGLLTVALVGYDGGEVCRRGLADAAIVVSSDYIPRIQEVQASIYHVITDLLQTDAVEGLWSH